MSEYLDGLAKDKTMGDIFHDLYSRADTLKQELDQIRVAENETDPSSGSIAETALELWWSSGREGGIIGLMGKGSFLTTAIGIRLPGLRRSRLISTTVYRPKQGAIPEPISVAGFRDDELSGDYSLRRDSKDTLIYVRLDQGGLWKARKDERKEPIGVSIRSVESRVDTQIGEHRQRLAIVAQGIIDNLTAVEWIRDGQSPQDVFAMMDKPQVRD